jgi:hypothetical protein
VGGHGFEEDAHRLLDQRPGPVNDHQRDQDAEERIDDTIVYSMMPLITAARGASEYAVGAAYVQAGSCASQKRR